MIFYVVLILISTGFTQNINGLLYVAEEHIKRRKLNFYSVV